MGDLVRISISGSVATIKLDRPPLNVLNAEMLSQYAAACAQLAQQEEIRVVLVTGSDKCFAAGADLSEFAANADRMSTLAVGVQDGIGAAALMPQPVVALVSGFALGGGFELALACDFRIAAESAIFSLPETTLGLIPGGGGTQRLARLVGPAKAKEIVWTGARFSAEEALAIGAVEEVVPASELQTRGIALAELLASRPRHALTAAKRVIDGGLAGDLKSGLALEAEEFGKIFAHPDAKEGVNAFLEKREPRFSQD